MQQQAPTPKGAWGKSLNHKTNSTNGTEKPSHNSPKSLPKSSVDAPRDQAHDRSIFLFANFIGKDATITLKNGDQYTGVFSGISLESPKQQYILKMARRKHSPGQSQMNGSGDQSDELVGEGEDHAMSFDVQDSVDLSVANVTTATSAPVQNGSATSSFLTDTQISNREAPVGRPRELQRWADDSELTADMSLGDPNGSWDQFAANEQMYGVHTTYDEDIYTTAIDRNNPEYKRRQANADRLAREIMNEAPANAHVAEERLRDDNVSRDDGRDEEDKYSGVKRDSALPKRAQGSYVPPSQRPITGAPSVPGAPFDPAIISSQLKVTPQNPAAVPPSASAPRVAPEADGAPPKRKEGTTEDRVRDTADAFKLFANNEKLRIRAAQEAKKSSVRQEKNVKLNDLKKFAANFKLKSRVPDDLVPILAKDREKQLEIQSKAEEAAKEEELRSKDADKAISAVASPVPSISASQAGPSAPDSRQTFNQARGARSSQSGRGAGPIPLHPGQMPTHGQSPRQPLSHRIGNNNAARQGIPTDLRIPPSGPPGMPSEPPMSPHSATRLNVMAKSFEFRPAASAFTPTGTSPSPQRALSRAPVQAASTFFDKDKSKITKPLPAEYDPLKRMADADYTPLEKQKYLSNGGLPQAYNTIPTWPNPKANDQISYLNSFPKVQAPSQGPSPMQTPNSNSQATHSHHMPNHMHGPAMHPSSHRQQQYYPQQHGHGPSFDPRMQQQFGPNGSLQNSPRAQQMPVAPFNNQMPPMQQPQYPGQPMPPGYGMSPSMQYRQPHIPGQMMMMPGQPQSQMQMRPGSNFGPGPQFNPQMGGHMMVQQPSGGYPNGPMPQNFSPMPPHAQPHMPHMQQHGNQGFAGSPRPPMMSHQGSHQGFQPMQPPFQSSPGQPHAYHLQQHPQQRAMSGGFPQMTPRQQNSVPNNHSSPGQGDEGK